jgi:N-methylhydantoinase A
VGPETLVRLASAFHEAHRGEFGHNFPDLDVELVNLRVTAVGRLPHPDHAEIQGATLAEACLERRPVAFAAGTSIQITDTPVFLRSLLPVAEKVSGPALVLQPDSTTLIPPGASFVRDPLDNLLITL